MKLMVIFRHSDLGWQPAGPEEYTDHMTAARDAEQMTMASKQLRAQFPERNDIPAIEDWQVVEMLGAEGATGAENAEVLSGILADLQSGRGASDALADPRSDLERKLQEADQAVQAIDPDLLKDAEHGLGKLKPWKPKKEEDGK